MYTAELVAFGPRAWKVTQIVSLLYAQNDFFFDLQKIDPSGHPTKSAHPGVVFFSLFYNRSAWKNERLEAILIPSWVKPDKEWL